MRVLQLPGNIASQISVSVRALRELGIEAYGLAAPGLITSNDDIEYLASADRWGLPHQVAKLIQYPQVLRAVRRADVIHWHYAWALRGHVDLRLAAALGKRSVVQFHGSDIRVPEIEARTNPYYAQVMDLHEYASFESAAGSRQRQQQFAQAGAEALLSCKSLMPHLQRDLFPQPHFVRPLVDIRRYEAAYPEPARPRPLVVHAPTAPVIKGTPTVLAAVESLRPCHVFDFELVQGVSRQQAGEIIQQCDIFVDQLILGAHGVVALEAMAYGKPVICFIKPDMVDQYPPDLPIVNATKESLAEVLAGLLEDGERRHDLGKRGRAYVERYHDARVLAGELVKIYEML